MSFRLGDVSCAASQARRSASSDGGRDRPRAALVSGLHGLLRSFPPGAAEGIFIHECILR